MKNKISPSKTAVKRKNSQKTVAPTVLVPEITDEPDGITRYAIVSSSTAIIQAAHFEETSQRDQEENQHENVELNADDVPDNELEESDHETLAQRKRRLFVPQTLDAEPNVTVPRPRVVVKKQNIKAKDKGASSSRGNNELKDEPPKIGRKNATDSFPSIKFRGGLNVFTSAIASMNPAQKRAVDNIGFGSLLKLKDIGIPKLLCHWLMSNYYPRYGRITFPDGQHMDVTEKDVEVCLGLPRGGLEIVKMPPLTKTDVVEKWRKHIGGNLHDIRYTAVAAAMLKDASGGVEFTRDFIVLFHSCLIEPLQSGAANQSLLRSLESVQDLANWNWCGFVIKCLEEAKRKWDTNTTASFTGPLLFVTILYLDRFVMYNRRQIPRQVPAFLGWTVDLVMQREHEEVAYGQIGEGNVTARQSVNKNPSTKDKQDNSDDLFFELKNMAQSIISFSEHARKLDQESLDDVITKAVLESGKSLLGQTIETVTTEDDGVHLSQIGKLCNLSQDLFWEHPDRLKIIQAVEDAFYAREELIKEEINTTQPPECDGLDAATELPPKTQSVVKQCSTSIDALKTTNPPANPVPKMSSKPPQAKDTLIPNASSSAQNSSKTTLPKANTVDVPTTVDVPKTATHKQGTVAPVVDLTLDQASIDDDVLTVQEKNDLDSVIATSVNPIQQSTISTVSKDKGKGPIIKFKRPNGPQGSVSPRRSSRLAK